MHCSNGRHLRSRERWRGVLHEEHEKKRGEKHQKHEREKEREILRSHENEGSRSKRTTCTGLDLPKNGQETRTARERDQNVSKQTVYKSKTLIDSTFNLSFLSIKAILLGLRVYNKVPVVSRQGSDRRPLACGEHGRARNGCRGSQMLAPRPLVCCDSCQFVCLVRMRPSSWQVTQDTTREEADVGIDLLRHGQHQ